MRYYIRHDKNAKVQGPFTIEALTEAVRASRIPSDALASSDLGEGIASLHVWRSCDWFPVAAIAELRDVIPPLSEPPAESQRVAAFTVICYCAATLGFSYSAITGRGRLVGVLAVLMGYGAVDAMVRYVQQREKESPAG